MADRVMHSEWCPVEAIFQCSPFRLQLTEGQQAAATFSWHSPIKVDFHGCLSAGHCQNIHAMLVAYKQRS